MEGESWRSRPALRLFRGGERSESDESWELFCGSEESESCLWRLLGDGAGLGFLQAGEKPLELLCFFSPLGDPVLFLVDGDVVLSEFSLLFLGGE